MKATFAQSDPAAGGSDLNLRAVRRMNAARRVVRAWRDLTQASRTLVACSGGADSMALTLSLAASAPDSVVVGHVVHDMRPAAASLADRDAVLALADALNLGFLERHVHLPEGNAEGGARRVRHEALASMASEAGCAFVATGHHADDQLESMLMALGRGAGLRGLRGAARDRSLGDGGVRLVRPMLEITRQDAERICLAAGVSWRDDETNRDASRRRAALRARVLPELRRLYPEISAKSASAGVMVSDALQVVEERVDEVFGVAYSWPREVLRRQPRLVIGEGLREAFRRLQDGRGLDRLARREMDRVTDAVSDDSTHERRFRWPGNVEIRVSAGLVTMKHAREDLSR